MRYAGIIMDDFTAAPGVCLTVFMQGCPHRCEGCHNPETWDFNGGKEAPFDIIEKICNNINNRGIKRTLCIMGGEPLCDENLFFTNLIVTEVKRRIPDQLIYIWTGYVYEDLICKQNKTLHNILGQIDCLIDGPYIKELRDVTLPMRGSSNQRILHLKLKENTDESQRI